MEIVKPAYGSSIDVETYQKVCALFEDNLKLLHPFMPFLSEELWHAFKARSKEEALIVSIWPKQQENDSNLLEQFEHTAELISQLRTIRKKQNITFKEPLNILETSNDEISLRPIVQKLVNVSSWQRIASAPKQALSFRVNALEYFVPVAVSNLKEERRKIEEELDYQQGFLKSVRKKLSNDRFVANAPEQVVDLEHKKATGAEEKIVALKSRLDSL